MTPKEKAEELYYKFTYIAPLHSDNKECALIAVDEVINSKPYKFVPFLDYTDCTALESNIKYWQEVKKEIEKL